MKIIFLSFLITQFLAVPVFAQEYFLEIEKSCTSSGDKLEFKCHKSKKQKLSLFDNNGKWYGRNADADNVWNLNILKDDPNILILENPVFFSGKSIIYIMKPTKRFYWSEFAYSEILNEQEATIEYGRIIEVR